MLQVTTGRNLNWILKTQALDGLTKLGLMEKLMKTEGNWYIFIALLSIWKHIWVSVGNSSMQACCSHAVCVPFDLLPPSSLPPFPPLLKATQCGSSRARCSEPRRTRLPSPHPRSAPSAPTGHLPDSQPEVPLHTFAFSELPAWICLVALGANL